MILLYGDYSYTRFLSATIGPCIILNFSGMREDVPRLNLLPQGSLGSVNSEDFDMRYYDFILNVDSCFCDLMNLLEALKSGGIVYLIMNDDPFTNIISESFMTFLKKRYGICGCHIGSIEDLAYNTKPTDFNPYYGIRNYDADYIRFCDMKEAARIQAGGPVAYE